MTASRGTAPATAPSGTARTDAASPGSAPPGSAALAPVTVLNDSRIPGLARRAAADVRDAGWPVAKVANLPARVPHSTVYFDPGLEGQARRLAAELGVHRLEPRPERWRARGLVLVVTRDYLRGS